MKVDCEKCHNATAQKWVKFQGRHWHVCKLCGNDLTIAEREKTIEKRVQSAIPELYWGARTEHLSIGIIELWQSLMKGQGLYIWGMPGRGKTYAMCSFARHWIESGKKVLWVFYDDICSEIRSTYSGVGNGNEAAIINRLCEVERLIIEDIGTSVSDNRQESDFSLRVFLMILDRRLRNCKPTFITGNKPIEVLGKSFDARVASRLMQVCRIVEMTGRDRRKDNINM